MQIPLTGVGVDEEPQSIIDADEEAAANGTKPDYEVAKPQQIKIAGSAGENTMKWKVPDTDQPLTGYQICKKYRKSYTQWKNNKWSKWKDFDSKPNRRGWVKRSVNTNKDGCYKVQLASSTPWVKRGNMATRKMCKYSPVKHGNG